MARLPSKNPLPALQEPPICTVDPKGSRPFKILVNEALQEFLSMVNPQNLSPKLAQAREAFLQNGKIVPDSFYVLGK